MVRNKLYDKFEAQGYTFNWIMIGPNQKVPKVWNLDNIDDWIMIDPTIIINGQPQVARGPELSETTVKILHELLEVLQECNGEFTDYKSKAVIEEELAEGIKDPYFV